MANGGIVSAEAEAMFRKALAIDPKTGKARFFLAMGLVQDGKKAEAREAWEAMRDDQRLDQQWRRAAEYALTQLTQREVAQTGGPSQEAVDQAAEMSSQDRNCHDRGRWWPRWTKNCGTIRTIRKDGSSSGAFLSRTGQSGCCAAETPFRRVAGRR
jgi:Tfp pilus assembly protein PilF